MIAYQKERVENAICFFASEHKKATRKPLYQTYLYKYLAFFEFGHVKKFGRPPLGLKYAAMDRGPVPIEIYKKRGSYKTSYFAFQKISEDNFIVVSKGKPNLNYFSQIEQEEMHRLIKIFADRFIDADVMSEASHQEIHAWRKTYSKKPNAPIDYQLTFDDGFDKKPAGDLSVAEENYLIFEALEKASAK
jgi:hypothetical protein